LGATLKILNRLFLIIFFLCTSLCHSSVYPKSFVKRLFSNKKTTWIDRRIDNFFVVEKEKLYRSAQLGKHDLRRYIDQYKIKTIVNLRGTNKDKQWWRDEKQVVNEKSVSHFDIAMTSTHLPKKEHLQQLLKIYDTAPKPILIHCQGGADRTGEAAACWVLDQQKKTREEALNQLTAKYRHSRNRKPAKKFFIKMWQGSDWARKDYDPIKFPQYN
jgi:protein tyrosine/serine phosphatase